MSAQRRRIAPAFAAVALLSLLAAPAAARADCAAAHAPPGLRWRAAWATAMQGAYPWGVAVAQPADLGGALPGDEARDQTFRMVARPDPRGALLRLRLTNRFGERPLTIGPVRIGRTVHAPDGTPTAGVTAQRQVTFCGGAATVTIAPGADAVSDPVARPARAGAWAELSTSIAVPPQPSAGGATGPIDWHAAAYVTSFLTPPGSGDRTADEPGATFTARTTSTFLLDGIAAAVPPGDAGGATVALGDSITDGAAVPVDSGGRWIDLAARELAATADGPALVDAGIGGNHLLPLPADLQVYGPFAGRVAIRRLDDDVLSRPDVTHLLVLEGVNDIHPWHGDPEARAAELEAALAEIVAAGRRHGIRVVLGTLLPFGGAGAGPVQERVRSALNGWIRASAAAGRSDGVIDFDAAMPQTGSADGIPAIAPAYTTDGLHPNAAGARAMAAAVVARRSLLAGPAVGPGGAPERSRNRPAARARPRIRSVRLDRTGRTFVLRVGVSTAGIVEVRLLRAVRGHRVGRTCRTGRRRHERACTAWRTVTTLRAHTGRAGRVIALPRRLRPGRYRTTATLVAGRRRSAAREVGFTVRAPRRVGPGRPAAGRP